VADSIFAHASKAIEIEDIEAWVSDLERAGEAGKQKVMDHMREIAMQRGTALAGVMTDCARDAIKTQIAIGVN